MNKNLFMCTIKFLKMLNNTIIPIENKVKVIGKDMVLLNITVIIDEIPETYAAINEKWRSFNRMSPKVPVLGQ